MKKSKKTEDARPFPKRQLFIKKTSKPKRISLEESDDSDLEIEDLLQEDSDSFHEETDDEGEWRCDLTKEIKTEDIKVGSYVLCEFAKKKTCTYYVGQVTKDIDDDDDFEINFYRKSLKGTNKFHLPVIEDKCSFSMYDIKAILPQPVFNGTTDRTKNSLMFPPRFSFGHIVIG